MWLAGQAICCGPRPSEARALAREARDLEIGQRFTAQRLLAQLLGLALRVLRHEGNRPAADLILAPPEGAEGGVVPAQDPAVAVEREDRERRGLDYPADDGGGFAGSACLLLAGNQLGPLLLDSEVRGLLPLLTLMTTATRVRLPPRWWPFTAATTTASR